MGKPQLARREEDVWSGGVVLDPPRLLRDVNGAGGHVVAGGDVLYGLRPGAENVGMRPELDDLLGTLVAVAAEQGPPWRFAVASAGGITVMGLPHDQKLTLTSDGPENRVTHMAWANFRKERVLYVRWAGGTVGRLRLDLGTIEELHVLPMDAIASDRNGALAMVAARCGARDAHALWTLDGIQLEERDLTVTFEGHDPEARVHLAVAGAAIAYAAEGKGTHVSRGIDEDFVPCEGLAQGGAVAFQGTSADAALFGVSWNKLACGIDRVDAKGAAQRIIEVGSDKADAPRIVAIQWDESRHALWGASPEIGLVRSNEPKGKGGKKRLVN
jgi:hypothetical protein